MRSFSRRCRGKSERVGEDCWGLGRVQVRDDDGLDDLGFGEDRAVGCSAGRELKLRSGLGRSHSHHAYGIGGPRASRRARLPAAQLIGHRFEVH